MKGLSIVAITLSLCLLTASAVYAYGSEGKELVDIHGFISQGYLYSTDNNWVGASENGTWQFNELGLNFTSMLTKRLRIGMQFFARDLGVVGNDEITVDWAYADFNIRDWLGIRAGQVKNPIGIYNEMRDIDFLRVSTFLPQTTYNENARDSLLQTKGISLYGNIDARVMGMFRYMGVFGTTDIDTEGGTGRLFEEISTSAAVTMMSVLPSSMLGGIPASLLPFLVDGDLTGLNVERTYTLSLEWHLPVDGLRIAGSFNRIDYKMDLAFSIAGTLFSLSEDIVLEQEMWTSSIEYSIHDLLLSAEFIRVYAMGLHIQGWYAMASYRLSDWFAFGGYYGEYYPNDADKSGRREGLIVDYQAWQKTISGFVRFDINENWLIKAEYQYQNGAAALARQDNLNAAGQPSFDQYWHFLAFKVTFNF